MENVRIRQVPWMRSNGNAQTSYMPFFGWLPIFPIWKGALAKWEPFGEEYAPDGIIANMNAAQKSNAWLAVTNDRNEALLGAMRKQKQRAPNGSIDFINSKLLYKRNGVKKFIKRLPPDKLTNVGSITRFLDASGRTRQRDRRDMAAVKAKATRLKKKRKISADRKARHNEQIDGCVPILDTSVLQDDDALKHITVQEITLQLQWFRKREDTYKEPKAKSDIPAWSNLNKMGKVAILIDAIDRYNRLVEDGVISGYPEDN